MSNESDDDDMPAEEALNGLNALRQLAEYKARSLDDTQTADKIRNGLFGENDLVAFLEKDELVDLMQSNDAVNSDNEEKGHDNSAAVLDNIIGNRYTDD